jgi:hypothetical protein
LNAAPAPTVLFRRTRALILLANCARFDVDMNLTPLQWARAPHTRVRPFYFKQSTGCDCGKSLVA